MANLTEIKKQSLEARKAKNKVKANLLITLISDIEMHAKNDGNREASENDVLASIKKFLKSTKENISIAEKSNTTNEEALQEKEILESFLPAQLTEEELQKIIAEFAAQVPEKSMKMMGKIMGELNTHHSGQFDGKVASTIVKQLLS